MPQDTAESRAVADVYAESLLQIAKERGRLDEVAEQMADLVAFMDREPDFEAFLVAESVDENPRRESLERLFRGKMNDLLLNLLQVLNNRRRLMLIRGIARCLELIIEEEHHQQEVLVETAMPLSDAIKMDLKAQMSRRIGKEALLIEKVKPELIAGVVIHIGDQQIDASVASRIKAMQKRLREKATIEIHSGKGVDAA